MSKRINLTGCRFGRWVVMSYAGFQKGAAHWNCRCDCGHEVAVSASNLRSGASVSCGCYKTECQRNRVTHGHARIGKITRTYRAWYNMKTRCNNSTNKNFPDYGGRGVSVCDRWQSSFANFLEDMGECPPKHEIDRIDVNGHYEPGNCRWVMHIVNVRNTRANRILEFRGQSHCITEWAEIIGIQESTIRARLRYGYSVDEALSMPVRPHAQYRRVLHVKTQRPRPQTAMSERSHAATPQSCGPAQQGTRSIAQSAQPPCS